MNYIRTMQVRNKELQAALECAKAEVDAFVAHLNSDKFRGTENGERKDWIATADVIERLRHIAQWL